MNSSSSSPTSSGQELDDDKEQAQPETIVLSDSSTYSSEVDPTDDDQDQDQSQEKLHAAVSSGQPPAHYRPSRVAPHGIPAARKSTFRRPAPNQNAVRQRQKATAAGAGSRKSRLKQPLIKQEEGFPVPSWPTSPAKPSQPQSSAARIVAEPEHPFVMCAPVDSLFAASASTKPDRIAEQIFSFLNQVTPRASPPQNQTRSFAPGRRAGSRFPSPRPIYPYRVCRVFYRFPSQFARLSGPRRWIALHCSGRPVARTRVAHSPQAVAFSRHPNNLARRGRRRYPGNYLIANSKTVIFRLVIPHQRRQTAPLRTRLDAESA